MALKKETGLPCTKCVSHRGVSCMGTERVKQEKGERSGHQNNCKRFVGNMDERNVGAIKERSQTGLSSTKLPDAIDENIS